MSPEIVEEQQCHDYSFRLTCRDLDSHIAILDAWYTSVEEYQVTNASQALKLKTENDSELNKVYVYSSPKHNGVYEVTNLTSADNLTVNQELVNSTIDVFLNDSLGVNETVDMGGEVGENGTTCGVTTFSRSYGSWREGDKRRRSVERNSSENLRAPLSYR